MATPDALPQDNDVLLEDTTLRDMIAASALQGLLANPRCFEIAARRVGADVTIGDALANESWEYADAMLRARKKK